MSLEPKMKAAGGSGRAIAIATLPLPPALIMCMLGILFEKYKCQMLHFMYSINLT